MSSASARLTYFPSLNVTRTSDWLSLSVPGDGGKQFLCLEDLRAVVAFDPDGGKWLVEIESHTADGIVTLSKGTWFDLLASMIRLDDLEFTGGGA